METRRAARKPSAQKTIYNRQQKRVVDGNTSRRQLIDAAHDGDVVIDSDPGPSVSTDDAVGERRS